MGGFVLLSPEKHDNLLSIQSSNIVSFKGRQIFSDERLMKRSSSYHTEGDKKIEKEQIKNIRDWCWQKSSLISLAAFSLIMNTNILAPLDTSANINVANAFGENIMKELKSSGGSEKYTENGMDLVETLKKRTEENKAKNDRETMEKSFMNSQAGFYGPFDKFIPVLKTNGEYDLVPEDKYKELVKQGKVVGRTFVDGTSDVKKSNTNNDGQ